MHGFKMTFAAIAWLHVSACATGPPPKPAENQFYKSPAVRRCLQYDKERQTTESQACWTELLQKLEIEPEFRTESKLSDSDVNKIRRKAGQSDEVSSKLRNELDRCFNLPSSRREERLKCFDDFLKRHKDELSRTEQFEIENAIASSRQAREISAGNIEATIEHAGKLLGAQMHLEEGGVRIDQLVEGPLHQAGCQEQNIIIAVNGTPTVEFDGAELVASLESCQDKPIELLLRHGEIEEVTFTRVRVQCGTHPSGERLWQAITNAESCSQENSPEMRLGINWCYQAVTGTLEIRQVCAESPAAQAGVQPGDKIVAINGQLLLGRTQDEIVQMVSFSPEQPLTFKAKDDSLRSAGPMAGPGMAPEQINRCWRAMELQLHEAHKADNRP